MCLSRPCMLRVQFCTCGPLSQVFELRIATAKGAKLIEGAVSVSVCQSPVSDGYVCGEWEQQEKTLPMGNGSSK